MDEHNETGFPQAKYPEELCSSHLGKADCQEQAGIESSAWFEDAKKSKKSRERENIPENDFFDLGRFQGHFQMSGYDKSPDYGGPPPSWKELFIPALIILAIAMIWFFWPLKASAAQIVQVIDGDTIEIDGLTYRLHGIDAPEAGQKCARASGKSWPCGQQAIAAMEQLVLVKNVQCDNRGLDDYARIIGLCTVEGTDINATMVAGGHAWAFRKFSLDYAELEDAAKAKKIGIWQADTKTAWEYRAERWEIGVQESPEGCPIKGNISDNGRIYHAPWSPWYNRTKISVERGERWFCDEAEALAAGWRAPYWGR